LNRRVYSYLMDLFEQTRPGSEPLAARMRPRTLDEFVGQDHIVGPGRLLRRAIQADQLSSIIFSGPPGTGKTTLARVIANTTRSDFQTLNAVLSGVKQIRESIEKAKEQANLYGKRTILFVDEVHRWNKAQQDALLPWVENGTIILIGATTENPYFEVNSALVSRSRVFQLTTLNTEDLLEIARRALGDPERGYGKYRIVFEKGALEHLAAIAAGDARSILNALELAVETTPGSFPPPEEETIHISLAAAEESIQRKVVLYDKEGDYHFDTISAFIKSIRGSDPDAVLYWLAVMVRAGEDPKFIFRRMLISACEDVGLADPQALVVVQAAASAFERIGLPEGQFHLTHAALYLAAAPKSNSSLGYFDALKAVEAEEQPEVPAHLKDPNRDAKGFGHGEGYRYPHAYRDHWVAQQYLPAGLQGTLFYRPGELGYEGTVKERIMRRRELQLEAAGEGVRSAEILTFSPADRERERWIRRGMETGSGVLETVRERVFSGLSPARHHRIIDLSTGSLFLAWEALRRVPEGGVTVLASDDNTRQRIEDAVSVLDVPERPEVVRTTLSELPGTRTNRYEAVIGRNGSLPYPDKEAFFTYLRRLLVSGGAVSLAETIPARGSRLSELLAPDADGELRALLERAEPTIYDDPENTLVNWDEKTLTEACTAAGFTIGDTETETFTETRIIRSEDLSRWLGDPSARYRKGLEKTAGPKEAAGAVKRITSLLTDREVEWKVTYLFLTAGAPAE
jgi:putative ATPase